MARPPKKDIDPRQVITLAKKGAKVTEIASFFGVSRDVIHARYATELAKGRAALHEDIRAAQIKLATNFYNPTMLIWLGKQYLGQSDKTLDEHILQAIDSAGMTKEELLELIKTKDEIAAAQGKRSFVEFCLKAGYYDPYPKQIEMMEFGMHEKVTRLLLGARNYGKTDVTVILGIAFQIYLDPEHETNLIVTKSKERNASMLREIAEACKKNGVVFDRCNATHLRARGLIGKDHSVSAVTIKTVTLRGRHPKRVVMDDPVTEDDTGEAARLNAKKKYNEIMKLTQNVLIIGQPAHQYDLYAELRGQVKTMEVPHGSIPELDHDLEAQRLAGVDEASISASYHLKILTEGTTPFNSVNYIDEFPRGVTSVAFIDPSDGGDYTAMSVVALTGDGVMVEGYEWKRAWNHVLEEISEVIQARNIQRIAFETNKHGRQPVELLQSLFPGIGVIGWNASSNKHARILSAGHFAHRIHLSKQSHRLYLEHVVKYEYKAKFDDAPDSLASCLEWIGLIRGKEKNE